MVYNSTCSLHLSRKRFLAMWECGPTVPSGVRPLQNSEPLLEPLQVIEAIAPTSSNHRWWFLTFSVHLTVLNLWSFLFCFLFVCLFVFSFLVAHLVKKKKNPPAVHKTWSGSLGQEDPLEKRMAIHSNFLPGKFRGQRRVAVPGVGNSWTWLSD